MDDPDLGHLTIKSFVLCKHNDANPISLAHSNTKSMNHASLNQRDTASNINSIVRNASLIKELVNI